MKIKRDKQNKIANFLPLRPLSLQSKIDNIKKVIIIAK